eukprot:COSAG02_NODE_572_length_20163_cov_9.875461_6_plen_64_part_00
MNTEARVEVGVVGGGVVLQSGWTFVSKSVYNRGTGPNLGTLMLCSYTTSCRYPGQASAGMKIR